MATQSALESHCGISRQMAAGCIPGSGTGCRSVLLKSTVSSTAGSVPKSRTMGSSAGAEVVRSARNIVAATSMGNPSFSFPS